jgi:RND family efflux transporter MFP subunit
VVEVLFEEGLTVKEGQVLARLDTANVQANLKLAQAQLQSAKSVLEEARVQQDQAQRELQRISDLARNKIATQAELDRAQAEFDSSKARLDRQQAEVVVAERQIALWEQQMEDMIIRAPFAGVVTTKNAQPGEMISPISAGGGFTRTGIGTIVDMNSLEIEVDVNESFINRIEPGQSVTATLDSYANWPIPSKVIAIIPTADRQKATVKVRIGFEKLDPRILPDMGVKVAFQGAAETAGSSRNVTIPKAAVRQQNGRDFVWVVQKGRAELREVTLGRSQGEEVIITAGLATGEKIVVKGPEKLADGDRIKEEKQ